MRIDSGIYQCMQDEAMRPVILFLGAGISFSSGVPRANELLTKAKSSLPCIADALSLQRAADMLESESVSRKTEFKELIARCLYAQSPIVSTEYKMLSFLIRHKKIKEIFTTNQDVCLERALQSQGILFNRYVYDPRIKDNAPQLLTGANGAVDLYKLCGDIHDPFRMCFSTEDLKKASQSGLFQKFLNRFNDDCTIVFIGYSASPDHIGEALQIRAHQRSGQGTAKIICIDYRLNVYHKLLCSNNTDMMAEMNAEQYLSNCIFEIRPKLNVEHAIFDEKSFGGVQTYFYSLKYLCEKAKVPVHFSHYSTQDFCGGLDGIDISKMHGFEYLMASSKSQTIKAISDKMLEQNAIDVLHAHNFISAYMAQTLGTPCVLTSHSLESSEMAHGGAEEDVFADDIEYYQREYYNRIPMILALSDAHIRELPVGVQHHVEKTKAPFIRPERINVNTGITPMEKRIELRRRGLAPKSVIKGSNDTLAQDKPTIAFFGRASNRKGLDILQEVAEILYTKIHKDYQWLFVGPDITANGDEVVTVMEKVPSGTSGQASYKSVTKTKERVQQCMFKAVNSVSGNFVSHLQMMYDYYLASDVVIIPSTYEPFGYVALEAMSCKRPVIAAKVGGLSEILADGRGVLVECEERKKGDVASDIAARILSVLENKEDRQTRVMIQRAKRWIDSEYSNEEMDLLAAQIYNTYLEAITRGSKMMGRYAETIAVAMDECLSCVDNWEELLLGSVKIYRQIADSMREGEDQHLEYYNLFWDIAEDLKSKKPLCNELKIVSVKELAQLITELERALPKNFFDAQDIERKKELIEF